MMLVSRFVIVCDAVVSIKDSEETGSCPELTGAVEAGSGWTQVTHFITGEFPLS